MAAQLALYEPQALPPRNRERRPQPVGPLCSSCRAREARYGFRPDGDDPQVERPRTLCFECFRIELGRRRETARAVQPRLPLAPRRAGVRDGDPALEQTLDALTRRRRRAQMAARRALGL